MAWPDQDSSPPKRWRGGMKNSRQPDQTKTQIGTPSWQIGTLRYLRGRIETPLDMPTSGRISIDKDGAP